MKNFLCFLLIIFQNADMFCQSADWEIIGAPETSSTSIQFVFCSGNSTLIGKSNVLYYTYDYIEQRWNPLNIPIPNFTGWAQNNLGNLFGYQYQYIYTFDYSKGANLLAIVPENIRFFQILANNNMIAICDENIYLYSPEGQLIKSIQNPNYDIQYILESNEKLIFIGSTRPTISYYSLDLQLIQSPHTIPQFREIPILIGDRIIFDKFYTDDGGINIKSVKSDFINPKFINFKDSIIVALDKGRIYKSLDKASTFSIWEEFALENFNEIYSSPSLNLIALSKSNKVYLKENFTQIIKVISLKFERPTARKVIKDGKNNLFCFNEINSQYYRKLSSDTWENINQPILKNALLYSTEEGSMLAHCPYGIFKSKDGGNNWVKKSHLTYDLEYRNIELKLKMKKNRIYLVNYEKLFDSKDNGETWDSTIIQQPFSNNLQRQDGIFKSYDLGYDYYIYGLFLYSSNINVCGEFIKNDLDLFPQNSFNYHFTTDFYNNIRTSYDGEKLFILSKNHYYNSFSEFSDSLHLIVKPQYGKADTFFVPYLNNYPPFFGSYTDHLGNYYLYNQNVLIMTRDEGKTWINISPTDNRDVLINDLFVSADNYIYIATTGFGIMKYKSQLKEPATLYVNLYEDLNQNCALDSSDILLKYPIDLVINNNQKITVTNGQTSILLIDSTYKINLESNIGAYTFCDTTFEIFADPKQNLQYLDIPIRIKKLCNEPTIELINSSYPYCDQTLYKMRICNSGITSMVDEKLDILLPEGDNLISSSLNIISKDKNKASLNIGTIKPQECLTFNIYFNTGCKNNIPESKCITLSLQDSLSNCTYPQENTSIAVFCLEEIGNPNRLYQINFYEDINENCTLDIEDILIPNDELIQNFKITFNTYLTNIPGNSFDLLTKENYNNLNLKYNIFDYKVCQENFNFEINPSTEPNEITFLVQKVKEEDRKPQILPNIGNGNFNLEFYAKSDSKQTITIFNDYGAVRSSQLINGVITNYDISEEPKGMYYLKVTSDGKSYFLKYLKL